MELLQTDREYEVVKETCTACEKAEIRIQKSYSEVEESDSQGAEHLNKPSQMGVDAPEGSQRNDFINQMGVRCEVRPGLPN